MGAFIWFPGMSSVPHIIFGTWQTINKHFLHRRVDTSITKTACLINLIPSPLSSGRSNFCFVNKPSSSSHWGLASFLAAVWNAHFQKIRPLALHTLSHQVNHPDTVVLRKACLHTAGVFFWNCDRSQPDGAHLSSPP